MSDDTPTPAPGADAARRDERLDTMRASLAFVRALRDDEDFLRQADIVRFRYLMEGLVRLAEMQVQTAELLAESVPDEAAALRADLQAIRDVWLETGAPAALSDAIAAAAAKVTAL